MKSRLLFYVGIIIAASNAQAALPPDAVLSFDTDVPGDPVGSVQPLSGSYFGVQVTPITTIYTTMAQHNGIQLSVIQSASGSHPGLPDGSESPNIDQPWGFFGNTGMHETSAPITILSDDNNGNVTLDFTGWGVDWNGIPFISLGGAPASFPGDTGIASMTCTSSCEAGDTFVLDYAAHVPPGDPSGFGGVPYTLHLEGTVIPVTAILPIAIDIKPGSDPNAINVRSQGKVPVAILTTEDFDASTVDVSTVQFGPGAAPPVSYALEDVDGDTDWDLVLHFNTQEMGVACGDIEATLTGQTFEGVQITGTDSIKTVGCKKN